MAKSMKKTILLPENDGIHYVVAQVPVCRRCHRRLKTPEAIERGIGKVCWEKINKENEQKRLFGVDKDAKSITPLSESK